MYDVLRKILIIRQLKVRANIRVSNNNQIKIDVLWTYLN